MSKIKFDLETAKWIADKAQNDASVFPVEFEECEKCGAAFLPELGHDCTNVIDIDFHEGVEYGRINQAPRASNTDRRTRQRRHAPD